MKCIEGVYDGWVAMLYIEHAAWLMKRLHILSIGQTGKLSRQEADPLALNNLFIFPWLKLALILIYTHVKDFHQNLINFALILGIAFN